MNGLQTYAASNGDRFPSGEEGANSLRALFPSYVSAPTLAGLSGDVVKTRRALENGAPFDQFTSWHYIPGQKAGGKSLVIWDKTELCGSGGLRVSERGRFVGFSDGTWQRIPIHQWQEFIAEAQVHDGQIEDNRER
jgi:hypothetical protein